jgi:hypothetical protein
MDSLFGHLGLDGSDVKARLKAGIPLSMGDIALLHF